MATPGIQDVHSVVNAMLQQATGAAPVATQDVSELISVAQTAFQTAPDPLLGALNQMVSKTIFSVRPYSRKFGGMQVDNEVFGNITRKILPVKPLGFVDDQALPLTDGTAVDMYKVRKQEVLQLNFYNQKTYEFYETVYRDQIKTAFSNAGELGSFMAMLTTNRSNTIEQAHETLARTCLTNFMAGKIHADGASVVHLLTEYNAKTGLTLDAKTVYTPENFAPFMRWVYSRIMTISNAMTDRTDQYIIGIDGKPFYRHTPVRDQRLYMYAPLMNEVATSVMSTTFNEQYLKLMDYEAVNYWQSPDEPAKIDLTCSYLDHTDGSIKTQAVTQDNIVGVLADREAFGYTVFDRESSVTPYNSAGRYWNMYDHFRDRYWNDYTEKAVVFVLD